MEIVFHLSVLLIGLCTFANGQNVPNDPLWSVFVQSLSTQTGRTVQDINTLGLSDPSINFLWTGYKANMPSYATPSPTTTPPPLPDIYQTSYSFSSNSLSQPQTSQSQPSTSDVYSSFLSIINQGSPGSTATNSVQATQSTSTSMQDILKAYSQFSAPSSADLSTTLKVGAGSTGGTTDVTSLMQQYASIVGQSSPAVAVTSSTEGLANVTSLMQQYASIMGQSSPAVAATSSTGGSADVTSLMQQYASIMGQSSPAVAATSGTGGATTDIAQLLHKYPASMDVNTPNYSQLLQQYNQIMSGATPAPPTSAQLSGQLSTIQLMALYNQLSASSNPASSSPGTPPVTSTVAPPKATSFEQQLAEFFPQFKNMFPSTPNASGNASGDATQMIFDTLLFGSTSGTSSTADKTTQAPVPNPFTNLIHPPEGQGASLISNHVENVFKTKASRELGCRFLPELLELDLLPTAPIDCIGKCPFPYINSQKFGVYCLCCPPGVNDQLAGAMSLFRRASYLETPLAVTT